MPTGPNPCTYRGSPILARATAQGLYHVLFVASAVEPIITADPQQLTPFDQTVQRFFVSMLPALQVAMLATKLYGLRLALWLFTYVCVPTTFGLESGTWVMAGAIGLMSRLQWKYYKK